MQFTQLSPTVVIGELNRIAARMKTTAPTIQLFQEFPFLAAPYTHGDTKNHKPASKQMMLAVVTPVCLLSIVGVTSYTSI